MYACATYRLGVDIGGTFTDLVLMRPGKPALIRKVPSTPDDYCRGIIEGLVAVIAEADIAAGDLTHLVHGTTVAANTILEERGARTALITTRGFRDVLEMRRLRIPQLYNLQYTPPRPLAPRRLRFEVDERMGPRGEVWRPLDEPSVAAVADAIAATDVAAVAVALINSYANSDHERRVADILAKRVPRSLHLTLSSSLVPEIREYERTSTAVVNAYIGPVVAAYLAGLGDKLLAVGVRAPLTVMQSNGGVMGAAAAAAEPAYIVESGPAAGVIAAAAIARQSGLANVISLDMGGTTAKAALIEDGEPAKTTEYEVGAGINLGSRLIKGGGHSVKLPFIDVSEIGAGGGSVVSVDALGSLKVGPRSAGAQPGPVGYGLGGTEATFTDALIVLRYLNPGMLAGGVKLYPDLAEAAVGRIAARLGLSTVAAAWGIFAVAAANMTRAVKAVSTHRGRDPRDFALIAFGGNGPAVAVEIARELQMRDVIIPPSPGVLSAFGLLRADAEYVATRTLFRHLSDLRLSELDAEVTALGHKVKASLIRDGVAAESIVLHSALELRYAGQAYELGVQFRSSADTTASIAAAFHAEHARTYGHSSPGAPVDLVSVKVIGRSPSGIDGSGGVTPAHSPHGSKEPASRAAYFGPGSGICDTPVLKSRLAVGEAPRQGPLVIEEYDTTIVVPPGCTTRTNREGNLFIRLGEGT
jgi:N-methylhydantoinase A